MQPTIPCIKHQSKNIKKTLHSNPINHLTLATTAPLHPLTTCITLLLSKYTYRHIYERASQTLKSEVDLIIIELIHLVVL